MSDDLLELLHDSGSAGVHRLSLPVSMLGAAARHVGYFYAEAELEDAYDEAELLEALSEALDFPDWFGRNLDALADCLMDLSWIDAPGIVIVLKDCDPLMEHSPGEFASALEVFADAAAFWHESGRPFWVFVGCTDALDFDLPLLGAGG